MALISYCIAGLSGLVAGSAYGGAMLALGVLTRAITIFGGQRAGYGWAVALGATGASFMHMAGLSIPLGRWAGMAMLGLGGMFVGMTAAALAELLELMPVLIVRSRVAGLTIPAVIALMLGKALGAVMAAVVGM